MEEGEGWAAQRPAGRCLEPGLALAREDGLGFSLAFPSVQTSLGRTGTTCPRVPQTGCNALGKTRLLNSQETAFHQLL